MLRSLEYHALTPHGQIWFDRVWPGFCQHWLGSNIIQTIQCNIKINIDPKSYHDSPSRIQTQTFFGVWLPGEYPEITARWVLAVDRGADAAQHRAVIYTSSDIWGEWNRSHPTRHLSWYFSSRNTTVSWQFHPWQPHHKSSNWQACSSSARPCSHGMNTSHWLVIFCPTNEHRNAVAFPIQGLLPELL
jgi:hypothetical protein